MAKAVYIAGPITGVPDPKKNFNYYHSRLNALGCNVLNPTVLPEGLTNAQYMRLCLHMIDFADVVFFVPGYELSKGAMLELKYCEYIGKPRVDNLKDLEVLLK